MRIRYNGLYRTIPFCGYKHECFLDEYYDWYNSWKDENFAATCGIVDSYKDDSRLYFSLMVIFLAIAICLLIYQILQSLERKHAVTVASPAPPVLEERQTEANSEKMLQESLLSQEQEG